MKLVVEVAGGGFQVASPSIKFAYNYQLVARHLHILHETKFCCRSCLEGDLKLLVCQLNLLTT
jgi:hypothetical protein